MTFPFRAITTGDAVSDYAIFRPSTGAWHIIGSTAGQYTVNWGQNGDVPVPADYDNDNKTDIAVFRRSTGTWYVIKSFDGAWIVQAWGNYGDQPTPADYDGDNKADLSVWRPTTGTWYTIKSSNGAFDVQQLGVAGDMAVPSSYLKQVGGTVSAAQLAQDRLNPKNATGGTDYYSRNFAWGTSLVNLPGRAGLNAGFGIGYNSLVWTKSGSEIYFDADYSNVTPGFRLGFPTVEPSYLDSKTGKFAYLMVTPSGSRVEFRQIGATAFYETADSGYVQLKAPNNSNPNSPVETMILIVTGTDGTQMTYTWNTGAFRCTQIKDRNGNYITIAYNSFGQLQTMTDTLGRVVTVGYDAQGYPSAITQTWKNNNGNGADVTYTWASFTYTTQTINTNFDSLGVIGVPNGTDLRVLDRITYPDLSYTKFTHNAYGQVWKVQNYAADNHEMNRVRTNLETPGASNTDCPKLSQTISWVENFNNGAETTVTNTLTAAQSFNVGGQTGTGAMIEVSMVGHPDGLYSRTYVGETGWKDGLILATEDCVGTNCADRKRWTWTNYTQDNTALTYTLNPRVIESRVGDNVNVKKTAVEYLPVSTGSPIARYGLVSKVEVFDVGLTNVIKRVETDYNLSTAYTDKRILGLPSETRAWGKNDLTNNLEQVSRMTYVYDGENFTFETNQPLSLGMTPPITVQQLSRAGEILPARPGMM